MAEVAATVQPTRFLGGTAHAARPGSFPERSETLTVKPAEPPPPPLPPPARSESVVVEPSPSASP
jgi:hypothetical protein